MRMGKPDWNVVIPDMAQLANLGTASSVGAQYYVMKTEMFGNTGQGFPSPLSRTINQTPPANALISYDYTENKSVGVYVQEELSWNQRLFLTGAIRFDDNSAFGAQFDFEKYPKLSGTWVISEENFWGVDLVNSLRLRGAWGKAGRQPDAFASTYQYNVNPGPGGNAILNPSSQVVEGFQPIMPTFKGQVTEEQLVALVAYIKSLSGVTGSSTTPSAGASNSASNSNTASHASNTNTQPSGQRTAPANR